MQVLGLTGRHKQWARRIRIESPNDVTTSYATASRCITMVPFCGETDRIATCRYKILRPVSHPPNVHSFVGTARTNGAVPPAKNRSFTSIQMVHTHTHTHTHTHAPQQRGKWYDDENEMKVKMEWKLPNQEAKRGTQEKRERANTNTTHLALNGQTPKRQGKKKSEGRRTRNQTSGGGGGGKRLNQPNKAKPKPTSARAGPNLPKGRITQNHMRKGTHGGLVNSMMHPQFMQDSW